QAGQPIIYKPEEVGGARSNGFKGAGTARAALDAILAGSGFEVRTGSSGAVAIVRGTPQGNALAGAANAGNNNRASSLGEGTEAADQSQAIVVTGSHI